MARTSHMAKARMKPKFKVRQHNRCPICGRSRAYMRQFKMCRLCFRKYASAAQIPGVTKSSW